MFFIEMPDDKGEIHCGLFVIEANLDPEGRFIHVIGPKEVRDQCPILSFRDFIEVDGPARSITLEEHCQMLEDFLASMESSTQDDLFWERIAARANSDPHQILRQTWWKENGRFLQRTEGETYEGFTMRRDLSFEEWLEHHNSQQPPPPADAKN